MQINIHNYQIFSSKMYTKRREKKKQMTMTTVCIMNETNECESKHLKQKQIIYNSTSTK